jgi:uncharacterized cupin superfamily protein
MSWDEMVQNLDRAELEDGSLGGAFQNRCAELGLGLRSEKLGFNLSVIPPGHFSGPYHYHHGEEELFLVIEGRCTLRHEGRYRELGRHDPASCWPTERLRGAP